MQKSIAFNAVATIFVKGNDYIITFCYMRKDKAINLLKNVDLRERSGILQIIKFLYDV